MFYAQSENKYIQEGTQFTLNNITYPSVWLNKSTPEQKAEAGLVEVVATNSPQSDQYYWVSETLNGAELTYVNTPKDLDTVKASAIAQVNASAYSILLPSDYMAGKAFETGTAVPTEWATWREAVRQVARNVITTINASTDVDEVALLSNIVWPNDPDYVEPVEEV